MNRTQGRFVQITFAVLYFLAATGSMFLHEHGATDPVRMAPVSLASHVFPAQSPPYHLAGASVPCLACFFQSTNLTDGAAHPFTGCATQIVLDRAEPLAERTHSTLLIPLTPGRAPPIAISQPC